ncbi:MAG: hypothetical protein EXR78_05210 [Deltaproteobacteria bacterium]|nr:hypothetical protein [Deltaproteobacteria bacterium]
MKPHKFQRLFGAMLLSAAVAAPAYAGKSVQVAQGGHLVRMVGVSPSGVGVKVAIRTQVPGGDAALRAQKDLASRSGAEESNAPIQVPEKGASNGPDVLYSATQCDANIATGFAPSDIHGAVGPSRFVVVTNVDIGVYNRAACTIVSRVGLKTLFAAFTGISVQTLFDPRVLYDRAVGRFFVTAESKEPGTDQYQYFAVSTDSTASAWRVYRFVLSVGTSFFCKRAADSFWDYPQAGKSFNRWFLTANDFPVTGAVTGAILAIDKAPTLTGAATTGRCDNNLAFNLAPPIVLDSSTQSVFLAPRTTGSILRYDYTATGIIGSDSLVAGASYAIAAWSVPPDAVQPNGQRLDSLDGRFQNASLQSRDRIWNIHSIASGIRPLIRWYRLQRSASTLLSTVTFQSSATSHLFNPSIVTNSGVDGSPAFITASRTDPTCTSTFCFAAMLTFSGPNLNGSDWTQNTAATSTAQFATDGSVACNSTSRGSCRWGDYSAITVDPLNGGRAWGFNQLINGTNQFNWFTRAVEEIYNLQSAPDTSAR